MAHLEFEDFLRRDDLIANDWLGEVVDNNDPEFSGRCKVRIFGKFDGTNNPDSVDFEIPNDQLPWAYPVSSNIFAGGRNKGGGSLSVPKVGTIVKVRFSGANIYAPEYFAVQDLNEKVIEEIRNSYQNAHVLFLDEDEKTKIVYTPASGLKIFHKDSHITINPDSSITIEHQGSKSIIELEGPTINITSNSTINITSNSKIHSQSSECVMNGTNVTKLGPAPIYSAVLAEPLWIYLKMLASAIDFKLPTSTGVLSNQAAAFEQLSTSKNVKITP